MKADATYPETKPAWSTEGASCRSTTMYATYGNRPVSGSALTREAKNRMPISKKGKPGPGVYLPKGGASEQRGAPTAPLPPASAVASSSSTDIPSN